MQVLNLNQNQIGDAGAAALGEALKTNQAVIQLLLHQNQIGDAGAAALGEALKTNKTVTQFYLNQNQIGDAGAAALGEGLKTNQAVIQLLLHQNQIGDAGAAALGEALKTNDTLEYLYLSNNQIGGIGLTLLKASWQGGVNNLYLTNQSPGAEKVRVLKEAEEAAKLKTLEEKKVKAYEPEADLNMTKIFAKGAPIAGNLADHNQTIKQVSDLIRDGNDRLQDHTKKGILLLGDTGAGKSTLAHLLSGRKLQAIFDDNVGELVVDAMEPLADIVIGHRMASQTKIPNKCLANGTVIWDCPGFNDTDPVQEIANSFYIKKLFETTDEMKFVLVVPESDLTGKKGNNFLETLSSFIKTFSNIEAMGNSISLVITQVPQVPLHKNLENIKKSIEKILSDNQSVTEEQKILVNKLVNSSLHLFHKPKGEGEFEAVNLFEAIKGSTHYIKSSPDMANMSVSSKALECSSHLLNAASNNFNKILKVTAKAILDATNCLNTKQLNIFSQNHSVIKDWVPVLMHHKDLVRHEKNEHFLELDLLFRLQKVLGSSQAGSVQDEINVLQKAIETIAEYAESGNTELKNQIQDYGYCLKQQYEYVKFFAKVCEKELPTVHLAKLLMLCQAKVAANLECQVSSIKLDQTNFDSDYYHKAISYLENYPASKPCIKLKALCYNGLASIAEHKGDSDGAISCYAKAIEVNNQLPEVYEKLGKLFYDKGQYAKAIEAYKVVNNEFDIKLCFKEWLRQEPRNADIMLKQAEYFESIGIFDKAKIYYHNAFSLSKNDTVKAIALEKIGNIMTNAATLGQSFIQKAEDHDFFNFDLATPEFIHSLLVKVKT